jgi:hypothetical protein
MVADPRFMSSGANGYLFSEEEQSLSGDFRCYFLTKRFNFIATLKNFPDLCGLYFRLDENWIQAMGVFARLENHDWIVPSQLTVFCFRELRLAAELLLGCSKTPGYSHLRSAIEAFVHAQAILRQPELSTIWLCRDDDPVSYSKHFKENFKRNMFPDDSGFGHLHNVWKLLCDAGPHPSVTSIGVSSSIIESERDVTWNLDFFQTDPGEIAKDILLLINVGIDIFKPTYSSFHAVMSLNPALLVRLNSAIVDYSGLRAKYMSQA